MYTNSNITLTTGNQGNFWRSDFVYVSTKKNFQIVIDGRRGISYLSDIAIDDISFTGDCKVDFTATLDPAPITASPPPDCVSGQFSCGDGQCISATDICNFRADCKNKQDESFCPSRCAFDDGKTCGWYNAYFSDIMNWKIQQGKTVANGTGPDRDHTHNTPLGKNKNNYHVIIVIFFFWLFWWYFYIFKKISPCGAKPL